MEDHGWEAPGPCFLVPVPADGCGLWRWFYGFGAADNVWPGFFDRFRCFYWYVRGRRGFLCAIHPWRVLGDGIDGV